MEVTIVKSAGSKSDNRTAQNQIWNNQIVRYSAGAEDSDSGIFGWKYEICLYRLFS